MPHDASATPVTADPAPVPPPFPAAESLHPVDPPAAPATAPEFDDLVVPAAAVIGLQVETSISSERARVEDRVDARVTRDVMADGRVAIPAGSRVIGSVVGVTRGGKVKEPARLAIRFHTLVLADATEIQLRTDTVERFGQSPANDSGRKIGGAAIGGAIIGGLLGGGKGALIGGSLGAGAGTAASMAGDRNPAVVAPGSLLSVRLVAPVSIQIERR